MRYANRLRRPVTRSGRPSPKSAFILRCAKPNISAASARPAMNKESGPKPPAPLPPIPQSSVEVTSDGATAEAFITSARQFLVDEYLPKIERCLEELSDEDVWWRGAEESNSIGNLI